MGLPPEAIADLQAQQRAADFEVLPDCWPIVMAWLTVQTQWRVGATGRAIGLDYSAVDVALRRYRIEDEDGEIFAGLQTMEYAALKALQG